jgi:hypothetical protein
MIMKTPPTSSKVLSLQKKARVLSLSSVFLAASLL